MTLTELPAHVVRSIEALARKFGLVNVRLDGPDLLIEPAKVRRWPMFRDRAAVVSIEYAVIASIIVVVLGAGMGALATSLSAAFMTLGCSLGGSC